MSTEASAVDAVAKYFFFTTLDENLSHAASLKALTELGARNLLDREHRAYWVQVLHRWRGKLKSIKAKPWASQGRRGFTLPPGFEVAVWASFLSAAEAVETEAVLLSRILSFSDQEIAFGLGVTEGTVRYRVGRGLRHLGGFIES